MTSKNTNHILFASKRRRCAEPLEIPEHKEDDWAKFLIIAAEDRALAKASPFLVDKTIQSVAGTVTNVTKQRNGNLLVECAKKQQSLILLKCDHIGDIKVKVSPHLTLNTSRGILRDRERNLHLLADDVILDGLKNQGVIAVKRFVIKREGKEIKTHTFLLTFNTPNVPRKIKVGYVNQNIDLYYPSPLRCFSCQKFGHSKDRCRGDVTCYRCGHTSKIDEDDDDDDDEHCWQSCKANPKCVNCKGDHCSSSKDCPVYKKEVEIIKIKVEKGVSYPEAKAIYLSNIERTTGVNTYAAVVVAKKTRSVETQTDISGVKTDLNAVFVFSKNSKSSSSSSQAVTATQTQSSQQRQSQQRPPRRNKQGHSKSLNKSETITKPPGESTTSINLYPQVTIQNKFDSLEVEMEDEISPSPSVGTDKNENSKITSKKKPVADGSKSPTKSGRRINLTKIKAT